MEIQPNYWLVVWDKKTGEFNNTDIPYISGVSEDQIKKHYATINPNVRVIEWGEGVENRPIQLRGLEYLKTGE